jgi:hypothetical protein
MTQEIKIKRKEGDEMSFKLKKIESLINYMLERWNGTGLSKGLTEQTNKESDSNEDYKSEKIQKRLSITIERLIKEVFSETDISEYPILWNRYLNFKEQTKGKKQLHFEKLSEVNKLELFTMFNSQLGGGNILPKGVIEGNKSKNDGVNSNILLSQHSYDSQVKNCKEKGFTTQTDKYGEKSRVELYSYGTLFCVDTCRPCYTLSILEKKHPEYLIEMEKSFQNKIQKEVYKFYKDNGKTMVDFFEKCWTTKMGVFHMVFEKTDDNNNHIEYQNLEGVIPFCEYIGFDKLEENVPFIPLEIPPKSKIGKREETLFKYFPSFKKMVKDGGTMMMLTDNDTLDLLLRSKKKERELV